MCVLAISTLNTVVRDAALKEKVQIVDNFEAARHDAWRHDQFSVLPDTLFTIATTSSAIIANTAGTFISRTTMRRSCGDRHRKSGAAQ